MIRFLLRAASLALLGAALLLAVVDATRSIAAGALVTAPLAEVWAALSPATLDGLRSWLAGAPGHAAWEAGLGPVLALPACAVLGALALLLGMAGYRRDGDGNSS